MKKYLSLPLIFAAALPACGSGAVAEAIRPESISAQKATGESSEAPRCGAVPDEAEAFVVDLPAQHRSDLEVLMSDGIVPLRYDCDGLTILKSCSVDGSYEYKGSLAKEQVISLANGDEVRANLPFNGASVAVKVEAAMDRGATLDLATVMVGQMRAARYEVGQEELRGRCDGATHFIKSAYVGAFAMQQSEKGSAKVAAEVFSAGASAGSKSNREAFEKDGDIEACRATEADDAQPREGCGAVLRLYMLPISPTGTEVAQFAETKVAQPSCPEGLVWLGGKCTVSQEAQCSDEDLEACKRYCERGDGDACAVLGSATLTAGEQEGNRELETMAAAILAKACELGNGQACGMVSGMYSRGQGVESNESRYASFASRGCLLGDGHSCFRSGYALMEGIGVKQDEDLGFSAYTQGCAAGYARACTNLGKAYSLGRGVASDVFKSFKLYLRACEGGSATGCYNAGTRLAKGKGTARDDARSESYYYRGCQLGNGKACRVIARIRDDVSFLKKACELEDEKACALLNL